MINLSFLSKLNILGLEGHSDTLEISKVNERIILSKVDNISADNIFETKELTNSIFEHYKQGTPSEIHLFINMCKTKIIENFNRHRELLSPIRDMPRLFYTGYKDKKVKSILKFGRHRLILSYLYTINKPTLYVSLVEYYAHKSETDFIDKRRLVEIKDKVDIEILNELKFITKKDLQYVTHNV